mmetsp:Transcript_40493/g.38986  ORF Transcript_40493/g.38986 Transcript_40493/m.38986 type:complete len:153 (+) Transcript_40493:804-1262(+)
MMDANSRMLSAEVINERQMKKNISDLLQEKITIINVKDTKGEMGQFKVENDLVTTFFDNVGKLSDHLVYLFVEELNKDFETVMLILYQNANELAIFYTYMLMLLKKLSPEQNSFLNTLFFCKSLARKINDDPQCPIEEFNKFFLNHLFKNYC